MKDRGRKHIEFTLRHLAVLLLAFCLTSGSASAAKIRELCEIQGARTNELKGVGYVVGLAGTGDKATLTVEAQQRLLDRLGVEVDNLKSLTGKNSALVMVTATLPAYAKEGTRIDVKVDTLSDSKSLEGGMLMETYLYGPGPSKTVYALASGPISTGGFNADTSGGTKVRENHTASGRIPQGATIEREVPSTITDGERIMLAINQPNFQTANALQESINSGFGEGTATALGAGSLRVTIPADEQVNLVSFIAKLQAIEVDTQQPARIVINERTGTIVVGGDVTIKPCQVAHGNVTIKIATSLEVTPAPVFSDQAPVVTQNQTLDVIREDARLLPVQGTSAADVAQALNQLKVTPRDMIAIFQALSKAGALEADLETM